MSNYIDSELSSAVAELTPSQARRAQGAFHIVENAGHAERPDTEWYDCPLALAYGEPGELYAKLQNGPSDLGALLGISLDAVYVIVESYDDVELCGGLLEALMRRARERE